MFPGEERKAVSLGGDCLTSSRRKTTSHDKKMFFKTWHRNRVLFILNAFSSLANVACAGRGGGGKPVFQLGPAARSQEVWALFLALPRPSCEAQVKPSEVSPSVPELLRRFNEGSVCQFHTCLCVRRLCVQNY